MLKSRLLTAVLLIAAVLWMLFWGPDVVLLVFLGVLLGFCAWEWFGLLPLPKVFMVKAMQVLYTILMFPLAMLSYHYAAIDAPLLCMDLVLLVLATVAIAIYPNKMGNWYNNGVLMIAGWIILPATMLSLWLLKNSDQGVAWLMSVLLITWAADTGAYFAGRFLGRRFLTQPFSPVISPNKTWTGFWGGFLLSEMVIGLSGWWFAAEAVGWLFWIMAGTVTFLGAVVGDLLISMLKRAAKVKDTGNVLPGHGGVLDRLDSLVVSSAVMLSFLLMK